MFKNYLIVALRNLLQHRIYSLINVVGLGIGTGCCILALVFIRYELSWDTWHQNADRIYRVLWATPTQDLVVKGTSGPLGPALVEEYQEVVEMFRFDRPRVWVLTENNAYRHLLGVADKSIFDVLSLSLLQGDLSTVFDEPYSVVVTASTSQRWFGDKNPIGQTVMVESRLFGGQYVVKGVMADFPPNSSQTIRFDFLTTSQVGSESVKVKEAREEAGWAWNTWHKTAAAGRALETYLLLRSTKAANELEQKLPAFLAAKMGKGIAAQHHYKLQPLTDIHLHGAQYGLSRSRSGIERLYQIGGIAVLIMLVACINFINLSTARASTRQREIGVRKTTGALRSQIFVQFMTESALVTGLALVTGFGIAKLLLPIFNAHSGQNLPEQFIALTDVLLILPILGGVVAALAGLYPAVVVSSFDPIQALRPGDKNQMSGSGIRKVLVVCQFAACVLLVASTLVMQEQTYFMKNQNLGFDRDLIIKMPIFSHDRARKPDWGKHLSYRYERIKNDVLSHPNILKASAFWWNMQREAGGVSRKMVADGKEISIRVIEADEDFLDLFNIPLLAGQNFRKTTVRAISASRVNRQFLLNEKAVAFLGWKEPVGKAFHLRDAGIHRDGSVVGVVGDFHAGGALRAAGPVAIFYSADIFTDLGMKVRGENLEETIAFLRATWQRLLPERPFWFEFMDQRIERLYRKEEQTAQLVEDFALLGILLGCLGLFGLASFTIERRRKEIGIRKVLGATVGQVVYRLCREMGITVLIANLIAWPIGLYMMREWLSSFAYRIDLHVGYFALAGSAAFVVAMLTVGYQAWRAARANPVEALRYE